MNYPYKIVAIIYRMFERRGLDTPYFRTCMAIIFMLFLHVVIMGLLFRLPFEYVFPGVTKSDHGETLVLKFIIIFSIAIALFFGIFQRQKVRAIEVKESYVQKAKWIVPIYFIGLILLMGLLLVAKGMRM